MDGFLTLPPGYTPGPAPARDPPDPRRPRRPVLDRLRARVAGARRARLRRDRRQPARLDGPRHRLQPRHLGGLGEQGLRGRHGGRRSRGRDGRRRPRPPRRRRLELRRHPHRLRHQKTTRFKAAASGASIANYLAGYGTDHYQYEYEVELGLPWKARDLWLGLSSPFFDVEKVTTPTLFLCGALDMNVPLLNSEQLYQALRRVGRVETELVVYPDQWHAHRDAELPEGPLGAVPRVVRPLPPAGRRRGRPQARGDVAPRPAALRPRGARGDAQGPGGEPGEGHRRLREERRTASTRPIALGRRHAALGQYREAIDVYTRRPRAGTRATRGSTGTAATATSRSASSTRRVADLTRAAAARGGPARRARARLRPLAPALDDAAVLGLLPPRPGPLPEGRLRGARRRPTAAAWSGPAAATTGSCRRPTGST